MALNATFWHIAMPSEEGGNHPIFYDPEPRVPAGQEQVEVGGGKTAVSAAGMWVAALNGLQSAMVAPTQILAEQHHRGVSRLLGQRALVLVRQHRWEAQMARELSLLGVTYIWHIDRATGLELLAEAVSLLRQSGDEFGLVAMAATKPKVVGHNCQGVLVEDRSGHMDANTAWGRLGQMVRKHPVRKVFVETNQGGDFVLDGARTAVQAAGCDPRIVQAAWSSKGKTFRAQPVAVAFRDKRLGVVEGLRGQEMMKQWLTWQPEIDKKVSPDRIDASVAATFGMDFGKPVKKSTLRRAAKPNVDYRRRRRYLRIRRPVEIQDRGKRISILPSDRFVLTCDCLLYTSPSPRDRTRSRMPSSA